MKEKWHREGSYTVEASMVLPLILTALASVLGIGFHSAQSLGQEMQFLRQEYVQECESRWPERIRLEQAVVEGFWEE